ncbi:hypothetical protein ACOME3_008489 [Neoechinorhynchus agilis]
MESSNIEFILEQMSTINLILTKTSVWQTLMFFLNTSFLAIGSANVLVDYFVTSNNYTCRVPQYISLLDAIPVREDGQFEKCLMYANFTSLSNETVPCTNGHSHALPVEESIVATFRLYCDREYLKNIPQSAFFGGATVGALLVAIVGDKYGKKPLALSGCWMSIVFGVGCALSNSISIEVNPFWVL